MSSGYIITLFIIIRCVFYSQVIELLKDTTSFTSSLLKIDTFPLPSLVLCIPEIKHYLLSHFLLNRSCLRTVPTITYIMALSLSANLEHIFSYTLHILLGHSQVEYLMISMNGWQILRKTIILHSDT